MSMAETTPAPRRTGRPSTADRFAADVTGWLRAEPLITGAQALQRARGIGYRGGKSAFYDLIRRARLRVLSEHSAA